MQSRARRRLVAPALRPLALAAAALLGAHLPAQAQYYDYSGVVLTSPTDVFPIDVFSAALDLRPNMLFVGVGAAGSFSAFAGADLQANNLVLGTSGSGNGSFSVEGNYESNTSALVELVGTGVRLDVGSWGTGLLTVTKGALLDASVDTSGCGGGCWSIVGNSAGSTGTLQVQGSGSEVRLLGLIVGQTSVFTVAGGSSADFGTPGGTTNAFVDVLAGGTLRTQNTVVANNNASPNGLGTEKANGTVTVSGAGSQWIVGRNTLNNSAALLTIGSGVGANGLVTVSNGGKLQIDGTGSSGPNDGISIGTTGKGKLVVTGAGSQVQTGGVNHFINVGATSATGEGTFEILAGASASTLYLNVGRNGGNGTLTISGGAQLTQSGVGTNQSAGSNGPAFAHIGRNTGGGGGTGTVTVSSGGQWTISDGGGDGRVSQSSPGLTLGRGANSNGTLTITGTGSKVEISSSSQSPAPGSGDNYNPFVGVGYDNPTTSSGTLTVSAGGQLILTGNALSTVANPRSTQLAIGGRGDALPATGTATVTGAGSKISVGGTDALIAVGRGVLGGQQGHGTLNVLDQAVVESTSLVVGAYGIGTVTIDNASVALSGYRTDTNPAVGAGMSVGRGSGGNGTLTMSNGATLTITPTVYTSGFTIAGDSFGNGGTGTVTMSGGSSIVFGGSLVGNGFSVGRTGNGTLDMSGASFVDMGTLGVAEFARDPGGVANATLSGGSWLRANQIQFGGRNDVDAGGWAKATVTGAGSELRAEGDTARVSVGRGGTGDLTLSDGAKLSATFLNIGRAATGNGTLLVDNATVELSGQKNLSGTDFGAAMSVGTRGGTGVASITNGSTVNITNLGSAGAALTVGGNPDNPLGTGTLTVSNGSQIKLQAAPGLATVRVGHDGSGTLALADGSSLKAGDGNVYVAAQAGWVGTLSLSNGSTLEAGFVGIGVSAKYDGVAQANGGTGVLVLNNSTLRTAGFELGAGSVLKGDGGTIEIIPSTGDVVIGGTIEPGNSPGRLRIRCNIIMLAGSRIILEVQGNGSSLSDYGIDQLIIDGSASFNLASAQIEFSFLGNTNPNQFAAIGGMNLDNFFRAETGATTAGLSTVFAPGQTWANVVDTSTITAVSQDPSFSSIQISYTSDGNMNVVAVPEPSSWVLMFTGLAAVGAVSRRRRAQQARAEAVAA